MSVNELWKKKRKEAEKDRGQKYEIQKKEAGGCDMALDSELPSAGSQGVAGIRRMQLNCTRRMLALDGDSAELMNRWQQPNRRIHFLASSGSTVLLI